MSTWVQRGALLVFALAVIPPLTLIVRARPSAAAVAADHLTWEAIGTFVSLAATIIIQARIAQDGCFGACAYPPMMPVSRGAVLGLRLGTQALFWSAVVAGTVTLFLRPLNHFGLVLAVGLLVLWLSVFGALCLAFGYEQVVPPRLRVLFALDKQWMGSRLWGRVHPGERSCVAALKDEALPIEKRFLALELIGLRPWVPGGLAAIEEIASSDAAPAPLAARAREILARGR